MNKNILLAVFAAGMLALSQQAMSVTTGLNFAGGCPESSNGVTQLCAGGANATEENVAAILGVAQTGVDQIFSGFTVTPPEGAKSGTWSLEPGSTITHIAFKADGYFILGQVTDVSGSWMLSDPITTWGANANPDCPATICDPGPRRYVNTDFLNNGGNVADLSNTRAFSVEGFVPPAQIPVPAAIWLFGSGLLGLVGIARRRQRNA